jgi:uncharacterized protein
MFDTQNKSSRPKIAIIGTGISGLSAAWMLNTHAEITVFEKEPIVGGHSHSVNVGTKDKALWVDMGFIVFNTPCYPNLTALFDALGVDHQLSDMSFGVSIDKGDLEYSSVSVSGFLAQWRNVLRPRFLTMLIDLLRFYKQAPLDLKARNDPNLTLGQYLKAKHYSKTFINDHLLPQSAAIWSTSAGQIMDYPFKAFIQFFENHGLLKLTNRVLWRTVTGGSQAYVQKLIASFKDRIKTHCAITSVRRHENGVTLKDQNNIVYEFDQVIFASHANEALRLLSDTSQQERDILSAFKYTFNKVILHTDTALLPKRRHAWASWNYIGKADEVKSGRLLCVTYWMNLLQNLPHERDLFVTLNPIYPIDPDKILKQVEFDHPLFDSAAISAQSQIADIQGQGGVWYCGAHLGSGFHEDGIQSGLAVAEAISGTLRPWPFDWAQSRLNWRPKVIPPLKGN